MIEPIAAAISIAIEAHRGQKDKGGNPYILHPLTVASRQETEAGIIAALLHDVVEDSQYTLEDLRAAGFSSDVCEAVRLLTHKDGEDYHTYIQKISGNEIAKAVKIQDLLHNLDTSRLQTVTEKDLARVQKYQSALSLLTDPL